MGSAPFTARVLPGTSATTIALSGELDMATVPILQESLTRTEADGVAAIVIDLVELTFIDSTALHVFVTARERAEANGRQLLLFGVRPELRRLFALTRTEFLLESENIAGHSS
jgi:anti-sigma B factor antagonist